MEQKKYRALLSQKQYLKLLFADLTSRFGDSLDAVAYSWIMYEVTGSESLMALILGLNYIPTVLLQPFSGALVDRINKKALMAVTDLLRSVLVALFVVLYGKGVLSPRIIAVLTLCTSTVEAFRLPAGNAVMPLLLEPQHYTLGKAASYSLSRVSQLVGFALSGALIALIGAIGVLWIDAVTFLISAAAIAGIRLSEARTPEKMDTRRFFSDFRDGLQFLKKSKVVQIISMIGLVINFGLMPLSVFQAPYVSDYLHMGPGILSYIKVLMIVGMMLGAAVTPKLLIFKKSGISAAAGIGMGISIILMYATVIVGNPVIRMTLLTVSMLCVGAGGGALNVTIGGCMMAAVPKEMMGRMSGLNGAIMEASMPVGSFLCSALVLKVSVVQLFALFGTCTIIFYSAMFVTQHLSKLDSLM